MATVHEIVSAYRAQGWATIRVYPLAKRPMGDEWQTRIDPPDAFAVGDNVGVRLGAPSGGLVDVDLDCAEAVALAPLLLPPTATFGRASKPRSHWLYRCATPTKKPPRTAIELRSTGAQTVFPGSTHESGEPIVWADWPPEGGPVEISEVDLLAAFGRLAIATVLARCWPQAQAHHDGHHVGLAVAGALWHAGWSVSEVRAVVLAAAGFLGSSDTVDAAIADTFGDHDRQRWGFPTLATLIGDDAKVIERMAELVPTVPRATVAAAAEVGQLTDLGNVERFFQDHGEDLRHVPGLGWLQWDSVAWKPVEKPLGLVVRSVRKLHRYGVEAGNATIEKWALQSEGASRLTAIESLAKVLDTRAQVSGFDADPWALNTPSGTIDLRTGELRPHNRLDLHTKTAGAAYDPEAQAPRFLQFLVEVFGGDIEVAAYMLRYLGSSLTGVTRDHVFQVWYGTGANGKSTLVETMLHVLGDYAQKMTMGALTSASRDSNAPSPAVVRLRGVRFTAGAEAQEGTRWNEPLVKELTGTDTISARQLNAPLIEFPPTWKIALAVNHKPVVRGTDHGIWRRIHLVPFTQTFTGSRKDPGLLDYLRDREGPGILAALVRGCLDWQRIGLAPPSAVLAAVQDYRAGQDTIGAFLAECTDPVDAALVQRSALYRAYRTWCTEGGEFCHGKQTFTRIMEERGFKLRKTGGHVQWAGLKLKPATF